MNNGKNYRAWVKKNIEGSTLILLPRSITSYSFRNWANRLCHNLFNVIDASGYHGWLGVEYRPSVPTWDSLDWFGRYYHHPD